MRAILTLLVIVLANPLAGALGAEPQQEKAPVNLLPKTQAKAAKPLFTARPQKTLTQAVSPELESLSPQLRGTYSSNIQAGQLLIKQGDIERADIYFDTASSLADTPDLRAQTGLIHADTLSRVARIEVAEPQLQQQALERYEQALPRLQGQSRVLGHNNYGSLLLRQNKPGEALTTLLAVKADYRSNTNPKQQSRYLYNLARAYEKNNDPDAAARGYLDAAVADTSFTPASRAVIRALPTVEITAGTMKATVKWLNALLDRGRVDLVAEGLNTIFKDKDWASLSGTEIVFAPVMRYFTLASVSTADFVQDWQNRLSPPANASQSASKAAQELKLVYLDEFPISFNSPQLRQSVQALSEIAISAHAQDVLTRFIETVGAGFNEGGHYTQALRRYALAVNIDNTNTAAALQAATILLEHPGIDPQADRLTQKLIGTLFRRKSESYLGEDWNSILRFHAVLGTIFRNQRVWGDSDNPYSAIFQFEHAIVASQRLQELNPEQTERIAGVKLALAEVFFHNGETRGKAATQYLDAARTAMLEKDRALASDAIRALQRSQLVLSPTQREMLSEVDEFISSAG